MAEARTILEEHEVESSLEKEDVAKEALKSVQEDGIVFIDEIDKICSNKSNLSHRSSADASDEGVQRDLLPLVEGTTINTKTRRCENRSHPLHRSRCIPFSEAFGFTS